MSDTCFHNILQIEEKTLSHTLTRGEKTWLKVAIYTKATVMFMIKTLQINVALNVISAL